MLAKGLLYWLKDFLYCQRTFVLAKGLLYCFEANLVCHLGSSVGFEAFAHHYILIVYYLLRNAMDQSGYIRQKKLKTLIK